MRIWRWPRVGWRAIFGRARVESELEAELRFHVEAHAEDLMRAGLSREEALRQARLKLGGIERTKEECRDVLGATFVESLIQDVRFSLRMLRKNPGFTAVAVITLALGIGANTTIFSFVNTWVLHSLPYPHSDRLVVLLEENTKTGGTNDQIEAANFYDIQQETRDFEELCLWTPWSFNLTGDGPPERILGARVSSNFFTTLGEMPALGRAFLPQEDRFGAAHVAVLSRGLWQTKFGSDPHILGRNITLGGESYMVVGVMPAKFQLPLLGESNLWVPLALSSKERAERRVSSLSVIGRLRNGVTPAQAQNELSQIASQLDRAYPLTNADSGFLVHTLEYEIGREQGNQEVLILYWIVGLVLLIACANVANLTLSRATSRAKELAVRTALGASRLRLMRQLITDTVLLFLGGAAVGVGVAYWTLAWIEAALPARTRGYLVNYGQVNIDTRALLYTFGIAFASGIVFGLAPAMSCTKVDLNSTLKEASGRGVSDRHGTRLRKVFVIAEIALAVVIVICSTLLVKSFEGFMHAAPGFQPENVLVTQLTLPSTQYKSATDVRNFFEEVMERVSSLPQIEAAGLSESVPFGDCCTTVDVYAVGKPAPPAGQVPGAHYSGVMPAYFSTMHIQLLDGRYFTTMDGPSAPTAIIINQTLANYFWPHESPIGHQMRFTGDKVTGTIVGVVEDVELYNSMSARHPREMYVPFAQFPGPHAGIVVRSHAGRTALADAIRHAVWSVDAAQPVSPVRPLQSLMEEQRVGLQVTVNLMSVFSGLALFLGAIGVYAMMAFSVAQRTHEFGIRLALGARPRELLGLVLANALCLAGPGIVLGMFAALGFSRTLGSLLVGVSASDPLTFAGSGIVLTAVALAASYLPARRAMRVDPMEALRHE